MPNKIKKRDIEVEEMDLKPFMNLMVVLIPLLLASAQFAKIATVDISLPEGRGSTQNREQTEKPQEDPMKDKMILMTLVTDTNLTLMTKSSGIISIYFKELHDYVSAKDPSKSAKGVEYNPLVMYKDTSDKQGKFKTFDWKKQYPDSLMFVNGVQYNIHEREEIKLEAIEIDKNFNKTGKVWEGTYRYTFDPEKQGKVIEYVAKPFQEGQEIPFEPVKLTDVKVGDQYYVFTTRMSPIQRRDEVIGDTLADGTVEPRDTIHARQVLKVTQEMIDNGEFQQEVVSAYDILKHAFLEVRHMNPEAKDRDDLIIASENQVFYDKVVQIMDVAKNSGLVNLSLNGLRSN